MITEPPLDERERAKLRAAARPALVAAALMFLVAIAVGLLGAGITVLAFRGSITHPWVIRGVWLFCGVTGVPALLNAPTMLVVALRAVRAKRRRALLSPLEASRMAGMGLVGLLLGHVAGINVVALAELD